MSNLQGLTVEDLRFFAAVVDAGSISAAAVTLGFSQSGLSRRIAGVERAAGVALLVRLARGVRPTAAGERLREHTGRMLEAVALAERDLDTGHGRRPRLRIGAFSTANATLVPRALRRLALLAPRVDLSMREHRSATLLRWVGSGTVDVAVVSDYPRSPPVGPEVRLERLFDDPLVVAVPADHPLSSRRFGLEDLAGEPWVEGDPSETVVLRDLAAKAGFDPVIGHRVRDWNTKIAFVAAGLGVALVPALALTRSPAGVVTRPVATAPPRVVSLATPDAKAASDLVDTFGEVVRTVAASLLR